MESVEVRYSSDVIQDKVARHLGCTTVRELVSGVGIGDISGVGY